MTNIQYIILNIYWNLQDKFVLQVQVEINLIFIVSRHYISLSFFLPQTCVQEVQCLRSLITANMKWLPEGKCARIDSAWEANNNAVCASFHMMEPFHLEVSNIVFSFTEKHGAMGGEKNSTWCVLMNTNSIPALQSPAVYFTGFSQLITLVKDP